MNLEPLGWGFAALAFAIMMVGIANSGDTTAERIEACMSQPNMQYVSGNCVPQVTDYE